MNKERNYHNQYQISKKKGDIRTTTQVEINELHDIIRLIHYE